MDDQFNDVVVVDDDPSVLKAFSKQIELMGYSTHAFTHPNTAFEYLSRNDAACLVVDLNMPSESGLELQKRLSISCPHLPTVFISGAATVQSGVAAMRGGAIHFLEKPVEFEVLRQAIEEAIDKARVKSSAEASRQYVQSKYDGLSERQKSVFHEVLTGAPNKVIAYNLGISERTVKAHRYALMQKLEAKNLAELLTLGARLGMPSGSQTTDP